MIVRVVEWLCHNHHHWAGCRLGTVGGPWERWTWQWVLCWNEDCSTCCGDSTVGVAVGQRSWMVVALRLAISGTLNMRNPTHPRGLTICQRKGSGVLLGLPLRACTVMSSVMYSLSLSGASSSKMANGLLFYVCCWWMGLNRRMLEGTVGSWDVLGILIGLGVGGGVLVRCVVAHVTLGDV